MIYAALFTFPLIAQEEEFAQAMKAAKWHQGPCNVDLGAAADLRVPIGYIFAGPSDTIRIMEAMGNIPSKLELGLLAPGTFDWFVVYEFADVGYIKDDEKNSLDADMLLKGIQRANRTGEQNTKEKGIPHDAES